MKQAIGLSLLGCGVLLLILSFVWPLLFGAETALSENEFAKLEALEERVEEIYLKSKQYQRRTRNESTAPEFDVKMEKAVTERNALREKLESGIEQPDATATAFWYGGLGAVIVGIVATLATRPS